MSWKSLWAVFAGVLVVIVVTTLVDIALHLAHVYPPAGEPLTDALSVLATAYRIVVGIAGGWVTARLAPDRPMRHALALGLVGAVLGIVGLVATWNLGLGPRWYPVALAVLAIPQSWAGGAIFQARAVKS
jgi:hypothetical protein